jgi:hypothetical protein
VVSSDTFNAHNGYNTQYELRLPNARDYPEHALCGTADN